MADPDPDIRQTAEWTVADGDPRLDKLIAYGRKLGLEEPHRDSFDFVQTERDAGREVRRGNGREALGR